MDNNSFITFKEANLWQNVQRVAKKLLLKNLGRWLADLTKREREWNLQSACASVVGRPSGRYLASRKSDLLKINKPLLYFLWI
jgi:hypothetical protein